MENLFQIDSFASKPFTGNPAGVFLADEKVSDAWMQSIAMEMNLSETAFISPPTDGVFGLRWFTPNAEVDLCGHATMAASHVLWETDRVENSESIQFNTRSGILECRLENKMIKMDFPASEIDQVDPKKDLVDALGVDPVFVGKSSFDFLVEVRSASDVQSARVDFVKLKSLPVRGVILTAVADQAVKQELSHDVDFISRFFAPAFDVDEDPVTGSAHCALAPYWSEKIGKDSLVGYQGSKRGGFVGMTLEGSRVELSGNAITVFSAKVDPQVLHPR